MDVLRKKNKMVHGETRELKWEDNDLTKNGQYYWECSICGDFHKQKEGETKYRCPRIVGGT